MDPKPKFQQPLCVGWQIDEFQNIDADILSPFVIWSHEMQAYDNSLFVVFDVTEMPLNPLCIISYSWFGLLFLATFACDTVNQIGTLASDVVLAKKSSASNSVGEKICICK